jgi:hypothetical protein
VGCNVTQQRGKERAPKQYASPNGEAFAHQLLQDNSVLGKLVLLP